MTWRQISITVTCLLLPVVSPATRGSAAQEEAGHRRFTLEHTMIHGGLPAALPAGSARQPRIGLALAGGGAKAAASIGVLKVLRREGIAVAAIAGTSMGSLVGGLAAAGYDPDRIEAIFLENDWNDLFTDTPPRIFLTQQQRKANSRHLLQFSVAGGRFMPPAGLTAGQKLADLLTARTLAASFHADMDFDRLPIPFRAVATDLETGAPVAVRHGFLHDAMRASAAVPVLFPPVTIGDRLLVDGGLSNNLPVDVVRTMAVDLVIAVDASSPLEQQERLTSLVDVLSQSISIPVRRETARQAADADILIVPDTGDHSFTDFARMSAIVRAGEEAAEAALPRIRELLHVFQRREATAEMFRIIRVDVEGAITVPEQAIRDTFARALSPEGATGTDVVDALAEIFRIGAFASVSAELAPRGAGHVTTLRVQELPVVSTVRIAGSSLFSTGELLEIIGVRLGGPLNVRAVQDGLDRIIERYREQGFFLARISFAGMEPDGSTLSVVINEGRVDAIRLTGQRRTKPSLLQREMRTTVGAPLNFPVLANDIRHLYGLSYFESVNLDVQKSGEEGVVVTVAVRERHRGSVRLGLRYDSEDAFTGLTDIVVDNIAGRGIQFYLQTQYGNYLDITTGYHSPVFVSAALVHRIEGFYRDRTYFLYRDAERSGALEVARTGGDLAFGHEWFHFGDTYLRYRLTRDRVTAVYGAVQPDNPTQTASFAFLSSVDTRDDQYFPRSGLLLRGAYEVADESYGGDVEFRRTTLFGQAALTIADRHTIITEASAGFGSGTLSYQEQYGIGGSDHLLGFPLPGYHRREFVGANQWGGLITYRWRIADYQLKAVRAVYLSISGGAANVWESREAISTRDLRSGAGIGIHADTVVGPFRLDLGAGEQRRRTVFFSAGFEF